MAREWQPNGSNYDYWRSDNPLIQGWWRFGGVNPKNNFQTPEEKSTSNYLSGMLVDSGPQKHHLKPFFYGTEPANTQVMIPVASIAPWDPTGSGIQFRWLNVSDSKMLYVDPSLAFEQNAAGAQTHGTLAFGAPMYSGFTVIGWVKLPDKTPNTNGEQTIIGKSDQDNGGLGTNVAWRVTWQQSAINGEYSLNCTLLSQANYVFPAATQVATTRIMSNSAAFGAAGANETRFVSPNFPKDRTQAFWFAAQYRREEVETNRSFTPNGSGTIALYIGTAASGLIAHNVMFVRGTNIGSNFVQPDLGGTPISIGADSYARTGGAASPRHVASGAIFDEFIFIADGFLSANRITHYALSGIRNIEANNPESSGFVPQYPGQNGLISYWDFDQDNGNNTCTATASDPRLCLSLSGLGTAMSFVSGINNGHALRVTPTNTLTNASDGGTLLAAKEYPAIPPQSGLPLLFPSGQILDEGMTIIGWMRSVPTGSNLGGGGFGWLGTGGRHNAFFTESITGTVTSNRNVLSAQGHVSGAGISPLPNVRITSFADAAANTRPGSALGLTNSTTAFNAEFDTGDDGWHLWAGVFDLKAGQMYMVRDAKHLIQMTQQISSASGWSSTGLGVNGGFFGFFPVTATRSVEFDQFAVYNRILSIPEMSGFALNGIRVPVTPPFNTTLKSLVGYWPLNGFENYDPTGVSGHRVNDLSWYRHHLTNVSGGFTTDLPMNSEFFDFSNCIKTTVSGSMLSLERVFHGSNLDGSSSNSFSLSGMSAGAWVHLPSGDLGTQGNGSSGLYGDHMIMGCWDQALTNASWFLGVKDNKFHLKVFDDSTTAYFFDSIGDVPFNTPFFVGCNIFPSGSSIKVQVVYAGASETGNVTYAIDSFFGNQNNFLNTCAASGFSLLNVANGDFGFPSGTKIATAFVHMGYQTYDQWIETKRALVTNIPLASGGVSTSDPANISHWRMNSQTIPNPDNGREQNEITLINPDGHGIALQRAIHSSGILVRPPEYLDTLPFNPSSRRLDLGSGTQSWTWLGWVFPNAVTSNSDRHIIMNKGGGNGEATASGIQIYFPPAAFTLVAEASGLVVSAQNGDIVPAAWNHLAVVYDRDNNKFTTIMNGRYAGNTQRQLVEIPVNNSGMALGGRGDQENNAINGGGAFSGIMDDFMIFGRALTLPEISGLAANSYNFAESPNPPITGHVGGYLSGIQQQLVSGLIASYLHGMAQDLALYGGYVSGVSGQVGHAGGYIHGVGQVSGTVGAYLYGLGQISGLYAGFLHGMGVASGVIGAYTIGAGEALSEFDISFNFQIVAAKDFDSRLEVVKTQYQNFDAMVGVIRITSPPECELQLPPIGLVASGLPYTLTVQGSGWAFEDKKLAKVRFTFADFKGAESGTLIGGLPFSGLFQASRTFDTPGWYTIKMEVTDSYGYRHSCARPFLLVPSGSTSGAYLATLPGISLTATPTDGITIQRVLFTYALSGLQTTSGVLEYTDFADQQETLLNGLEVPSGTQFVDFVRTHDYTMPGSYSPVWAVSGSWGVVSDSISAGIDFT